MDESATDRVIGACRLAREKADGDHAIALDTLLERLSQPLRIAIVGRIKAGKSTLLNALVGQRVAATDAAEATQVVTEYRYGFPERLLVRLRDGRDTTRPLDVGAEGETIIDLGAPATDVAGATAWLANGYLTDLVLVDTPGLSSPTPGVAQAARELMGLDRETRSAVAGADALIVLVSATPRADEVEALAAFRDLFGGFRGSAVNVIALVSKPDTLTDGNDPLESAHLLAHRYASDPRVRPLVSHVVAVLGLVAETVESGAFTEADARHMALLSEMSVVDRELLLTGADAFIGFEAPVASVARARLLARLGLYGIRLAIDEAAAGRGGAGPLTAALRRASGIEFLRGLIDTTFRARADLLKADTGLSALERLAQEPGLGSIRDEVERIRLDPAMHGLNELHALRTVASDPDVELPEELAVDLRRVLGETADHARLAIDPDSNADTVRHAAAVGAGRWNRFRNGGHAGPKEARLADVLIRSYTILGHRAGNGDESGAEGRG